MPSVAVKPGTGEAVHVAPTSFLGRDLFARYLMACTRGSARFDKKLKVQTAPVQSLPDLVAALKANGFEVFVDPALAGKLEKKADQYAERARVARERVASLSAELAQRSNLTPFPFQVEGVVWLQLRDAGILADDPGLGKTMQALLALPDEPATLVVAPANAKYVWLNEGRKWRRDIKRIEVLNGSNSFRWPKRGEVVAVNYDILPKQLLAAPADGTVLIADECHYLKNSKAQRTERFRALADAVRAVAGKVYGLSGTPLMNRPQELWSLLMTFGLAREAFPGGWREFCQAFNGTHLGGWGGMAWGTPDPSVATKLRPVMLRRKREEVLPDLPTKIRRNVLVESLDLAAQQASDAVVEKLKTFGVDLDKAVQAGDLSWMRLVHGELMSARRLLAEAKIPLMMEMIEDYEDQGEPLVVFCSHVKPVYEAGAREGWRYIAGDVEASERNEIEQAFQAGKLKGLAISSTAGGVALTLTRSHQALFVDLDWTPSGNKQCEDRVCRIGQDRGVIITRLIANHYLDVRVCELLAKKQELIDGSVEKARIREGAIAEHDEHMAARLKSVAATVKEAPPEPMKAANPRHKARTATETWATNGLLALAAMDPDRAQELNGVGFNKLDGPFGHKLAKELEYGLTQNQWDAAVRLLRKYVRQIGAPPVVQAAEEMRA